PREHQAAIELGARVVRVLALRAVELRTRGVDLVEVIVGLAEVGRDAGCVRIELARGLERCDRFPVLAEPQQAAPLDQRRARVARVELARAPRARECFFAAAPRGELLRALAQHGPLVRGDRGQCGEPHGHRENTRECRHERIARPPAIPSKPASTSSPVGGSGTTTRREAKDQLHLGITSSKLKGALNTWGSSSVYRSGKAAVAPLARVPSETAG